MSVWNGSNVSATSAESNGRSCSRLQFQWSALSVQMPCPTTRVCRFLVTSNIYTSVVSFDLSLLVGSIAHSATILQICAMDMDAEPSNQGSNSLVIPAAPLAGYVFLCCPHVGPIPDFEQLQDRRMEWSPLMVSNAWSPQWLCRQCCRTVGEPPSLPGVPCSRCGVQCQVLVTDFSSGDSGMWCPNCQLRTECENAQSRPIVQDSARPQPNWFTHGPLSTFGHLYGWGAAPTSPPGSGSQSWLLCPLISLGLLDAEHARGNLAYSTGSRLPVPEQQRACWMSHAMDIIHVLNQHFQS